MREKLIQYVNFLFAGAPDAEEIKQEILQNTLDRYDDLVAEGKTPEAAYTLAISGIGDISELLECDGVCTAEQIDIANTAATGQKSSYTPMFKKILRAAAIALYIISVIPMFILSELGLEIIGLCGMLVLVAIATALIIISGGGKAKENEKETKRSQDPLHKAIDSVSGVVTLCVYLGVSFATGAWWITWLIFPISGAVEGLIKACNDLKEAKNHES